MAICPDIVLEKIRAKVVIGGRTIQTPDVKNFSISRNRGSLYATCSLTFELPVTTVLEPAQDIKVYRIVNGVEDIRFTGQIDSVNVNPVFEKANYYSISVQASDRMKELENRKFSRRFRVQGMSVFAAITNVTLPDNVQRGTGMDKQMVLGEHEIIWPSTSFSTEHPSDVIRAPNLTSSTKQTELLPKLSGSPAERRLTGIASQLTSYVLVPSFAIVMNEETQVFSLDDTSLYDQDAVWSVSDSTIGTITDNGDGTVTYYQLESGTVTITYTDSNGLVGKATSSSMPRHTHEDLESGGPAWGVYKTE